MAREMKIRGDVEAWVPTHAYKVFRKNRLTGIVLLSKGVSQNFIFLVSARIQGRKCLSAYQIIQSNDEFFFLGYYRTLIIDNFR